MLAIAVEHCDCKSSLNAWYGSRVTSTSHVFASFRMFRSITAILMPRFIAYSRVLPVSDAAGRRVQKSHRCANSQLINKWLFSISYAPVRR